MYFYRSPPLCLCMSLNLVLLLPLFAFFLPIFLLFITITLVPWKLFGAKKPFEFSLPHGPLYTINLLLYETVSFLLYLPLAKLNITTLSVFVIARSFSLSHTNTQYTELFIFSLSCFPLLLSISILPLAFIFLLFSQSFFLFVLTVFLFSVLAFTAAFPPICFLSFFVSFALFYFSILSIFTHLRLNQKRMSFFQRTSNWNIKR